eukprot:403334641
MGNTFALCCVDRQNNNLIPDQYQNAHLILPKEQHSPQVQYTLETSTQHKFPKDEHDSSNEHEENQTVRYSDAHSTNQDINDAAGNDGSKSKKLDKQMTKSLVDDHLEKYQYLIDLDEEIVDLSQHRNEFESELIFTKSGIVSYIDQSLEFEQGDSEKKLWEQKLNKENAVVWLKKGGSKFEKNQPYIRVETTFNSFYQINKIVEAIFSPEHRQKWDKDVLAYELIKLSSDNVYMNYQMNKTPIGANKDFYDKQIKFEQNGQIYLYYSAVPDDTLIKPPPAKVDRARTIVGMGKIYRRAEDDKIVYSMLMQCDLKMKITSALIAMFLPKGLLDWSKKVNKYINDNYDTIQ